MKIMTVVGARPQFIKAAAVSRAIAKHSDVEEVLVHTGQHYDESMSEIFFEQLSIPRPQHHLGIGGGTHGAMTGRQLEKVEALMLAEAPDCVMVFGDTNSTLAGALAAAKLHIPVAHVEAGLRSYNRRMPEELNRLLTDHLSDFLFAPTLRASETLRAEGFPESRIHLSGDVMYDAAMFYQARARRPDWLDSLGLGAGEYVLCTMHRAENVDDRSRLESILRGLAGSNRPVILPVHPRTRSRLQQAALSAPENVHLVDPVGYLEMIWLEMHACLIATDSGGVQKEAFFHGRHCVTFRDETEWMELVDHGWNILVGTDPDRIAAALNDVRICSDRPDIFGNGHSSEEVAAALIRNLQSLCG